jgi:hypothetical protein
MPPAITASSTIVVPGRCNGPLHSGNGGYSSGVFARLLDGPVHIDLRRPVPLDTALDVQRADGVRILDGDELVGEVHGAPELDIDVPLVDPAQARAASARYEGTGLELFSQCYVCGPERIDSFGVHAAPVTGRRLVATPWTPPAWAADEDGAILAEHVWAALDCPTYFAAHLGEPPTTSFLVRMQARLDEPVTAGTEHVVVAWPLAIDGRKRHAASAVLSAGGDVLAVAKVLLVQAR